jgi:signal transduction histidine kinase
VAEIRDTEEEIDLAYLDANLPGSFDSCQDGVSRISTIVRAMKEFAHPDQKEKAPADLNQALQTTLNIAKERIQVRGRRHDRVRRPAACLVPCGRPEPGLLEPDRQRGPRHRRCGGPGREQGHDSNHDSREGDLARIDVADTGSGIPEAIRHRIFDPFFTTKEVGKGSGQGLAIARDIVVTKHHGSLTFESEVGKGTTFTIRLPIGGERDSA